MLLDAGSVWVLRVAASPAAVFAAFMVASLVRSVGLSPGGLGTFEASSALALTLSGVPAPAAFSATVLFRGLSFWLPMAPVSGSSARSLAGDPLRHPPGRDASYKGFTTPSCAW